MDLPSTSDAESCLIAIILPQNTCYLLISVSFEHIRSGFLLSAADTPSPQRITLVRSGYPKSAADFSCPHRISPVRSGFPSAELWNNVRNGYIRPQRIAPMGHRKIPYIKISESAESVTRF